MHELISVFGVHPNMNEPYNFDQFKALTRKKDAPPPISPSNVLYKFTNQLRHMLDNVTGDHIVCTNKDCKKCVIYGFKLSDAELRGVYGSDEIKAMLRGIIQAWGFTLNLHTDDGVVLGFTLRHTYVSQKMSSKHDFPTCVAFDRPTMESNCTAFNVRVCVDFAGRQIDIHKVAWLFQ